MQACPTGIDIRKGLQYECIACAACIDACDPVMDKIGHPRGLIRYSTQAEMDGRKTRILRPRVIMYATLLSLLFIGFAVTVSLRVPVNIDVLRDRNTLYRELPDGGVENVYTIRIINKDRRAHDFTVGTQGLANATVDSDVPVHGVPAKAVRTAVVRVRVPASHAHGGQDFQIVVQAADTPGIVVRSRARFFADSAREITESFMSTVAQPRPWYRHPLVWLVVTPPVGAVIAGIITMVLILQAPERDVRLPYPAVPVIQGIVHNSVVPPAN